MLPAIRAHRRHVDVVLQHGPEEDRVLCGQRVPQQREAGAAGRPLHPLELHAERCVATPRQALLCQAHNSCHFTCDRDIAVASRSSKQLPTSDMTAPRGPLRHQRYHPLRCAGHACRCCTPPATNDSDTYTHSLSILAAEWDGVTYTTFKFTSLVSLSSADCPTSYGLSRAGQRVSTSGCAWQLAWL